MLMHTQTYLRPCSCIHKHTYGHVIQLPLDVRVEDGLVAFATAPEHCSVNIPGVLLRGNSRALAVMVQITVYYMTHYMCVCVCVCVYAYMSIIYYRISELGYDDEFTIVDSSQFEGDFHRLLHLGGSVRESVSLRVGASAVHVPATIKTETWVPWLQTNTTHKATIRYCGEEAEGTQTNLGFENRLAVPQSSLMPVSFCFFNI